MRCHVERGYGNWSPYGWTSDMPFLIVIVTCTIGVQFYARKIGRQHSTCCWRDLCSWPNDMVTVFYWTLSVQKDSEVSYWCWPGMWCIGQLYTLFWILSESGTAYCLSWRHLHWFDIVFIVFWHWAVYPLQVMRIYSWKLSEKSSS